MKIVAAKGTLIFFANFCVTCGRGLSITARLRSQARNAGYGLEIRNVQYSRHNRLEAEKLGKVPLIWNPINGKVSEGTDSITGVL